MHTGSNLRIYFAAAIMIGALFLIVYDPPDKDLKKVDLGVDYSARYVELSKKTSWTESEYKEMEKERCLGEKEIYSEIENRGYKLTADTAKDYQERCEKYL